MEKITITRALNELKLLDKKIMDVTGNSTFVTHRKSNNLHIVATNENEVLFDQRVKSNLPIPKEVMVIYNIFIKNGHELYIVGGAVRDTLISKPIKDYDLATDATPDIVEKLMAANNIRTIATGEQFGVINAFIGDEEYEIATFREDSLEGDGRRPDSVTFSDIETDVKRRDLTMNALFYDIGTKEIVDLVGGIADIKNGVVRTVGKAGDRFNEDRLRILRAIRFAARVGSNLHPDIIKALDDDNSLDKISGERIVDEILKGIKSAKEPQNFMKLMNRFGLFDKVLPNIGPLNKSFINSHNDVVVLAALLRDVDFNTLGKKLNALKYSKEMINNIKFLVRFNQEMSAENFYDLKLKFTDTHVDANALREFGSLLGMDANKVNKFINFKLTIDGNNIMRDYDIPKGKEVYVIKKKLENDLFNKTL